MVSINIIRALHSAFINSTGVVTDSRKVLPGNLFFALKGENFDGNLFASQALERGASSVVVSAESKIAADWMAAGGADPAIIPVEDTLDALQALARYHRSQFRIPVIALTGTNGKTTTKELITAVLSQKYNVTSTEGNLNNHIGVPLTLLRIDAATQIAVVEMGANHPGEISLLASVALPTFGLVTNVGRAHLEGFGSLEGVRRAKGELYDYLQRTADVVFYNVSDENICEMVDMRPDLRRVPYGVGVGEETLVLPADDDYPFLRLSIGDDVVKTHLVGAYNAVNIMAALKIGEYFGVGKRQAIDAIEGYIPYNHRSQLIKREHNNIVVDAYNANTESMISAISAFGNTGFGGKTVILGDMLEMGEGSVAQHSIVLDAVERAALPEAFFIGGEFAEALSRREMKGCKVHSFMNVEEMESYLSENPLKRRTILLKGSNGMHLSDLILYL